MVASPPAFDPDGQYVRLHGRCTKWTNLGHFLSKTFAALRAISEPICGPSLYWLVKIVQERLHFLVVTEFFIAFFTRLSPSATILISTESPFQWDRSGRLLGLGAGAAGRIDKFELGLEIVPDKAGHDASYHLKITFAEERSQPIVSSVTYWFGESSFVTLERSSEPRKTVIVCPRGKAEFRLAIDEHWWFFGYVIRNREREYPDISSIERKIIDYVSDILQEQYGNGHEISVLDMMNRQFPRIIPVAPLRSKPKRTYDPVRETESPEGEHIPMLMMRLDRTDKRGWNTLHVDLTTPSAKLPGCSRILL